jgi:hypothetical protein
VRAGQEEAFDFRENEDVTMTDNMTGLMWQQEDNDASYTWEQALTYCEDTLTLAGYSDWRLPSRRELVSIVDHGTIGPCIDSTSFPNTLSFYWSSTSSAYFTSYAWYVHFYHGYVDSYPKSYNHYVRCVRAGQ